MVGSRQSNYVKVGTHREYKQAVQFLGNLAACANQIVDLMQTLGMLF